MSEFTLLEQAALEHAAAFTTDRNGLIEFANSRYCAMRGEPAERLRGRHLPWVARLAATVDPAGQQPLWQGELPPECGSGLTGTIVPRRDTTGAPIGFLCLVSLQTTAPLTQSSLPGDPHLVGIFLASPEGEPLFISNQIHSRYTLLPLPLCGIEAPVCSLEQWQQTPDAGWRHWVRGRVPSFVAEFELTTRNGDTERLRLRANRLLAGDQSLGIVGTLSSLDPMAERLVHRLPVPENDSGLAVLLDRLLAHAARFAQDLLRVGRLHNLGEVEDFLQGLAAVALASQTARLPDPRPIRDNAAAGQWQEQLA